MPTVKLIFLFLSIYPLIIIPHKANAVDISHKLCRRTTHNSICLSIVKADRRASLKTNPNGIGIILRDKALATAKATSLKISRILSTRAATNRHEVEALKSCSEGYKRAVSSLKSADFGVINRETYMTLVAAISNANDEPRDCELAFQEPPAVRSPISAEDERLRDVCATTLEIVNLVVCKSTTFC